MRIHVCWVKMIGLIQHYRSLYFDALPSNTHTGKNTNINQKHLTTTCAMPKTWLPPLYAAKANLTTVSLNPRFLYVEEYEMQISSHH